MNDTNTLLNELCEHVDSLVTIFTEGSGRIGFTGLLSSVNCDAVKLITCTGGRRFGVITLIPLDQITACTFCNTTF